MAISRPFLLVLLGVVLMGATVVAVQNARDRSDSSAATPSPSGSEPAASLGPEGTLGAAFSGSGALDSAKLDARVAFRQADGEGQGFRVDLNGAFQESGKGQMPLFDIRLKADAGGEGVTAGAVSLGDRAFLVQGDTAYRVPQALWTELQEARRQIASYAQGESTATPGLLGINPAAWLTDVKDEGEAQVDGVTTNHVSASVDAAKLARDLLPLARQGGASVELPPNLGETVGKVVKQADVDVYVGQEDRILRRLQVALELDFSQVAGNAGDKVGRAEIDFSLEFSDVNQPQDIEAPANVAAGAPGAEGGVFSSAILGVGVLAIDPPPGLAQARQAGFRIGDVTSPAPITNNPRKVARAVRDNQKVVIFFQNPRGLDDQANAEAVRALRGQTKARVFVDDIRSVDRYGTIVEEVGVNQAPSIVIIDRRGKARLIEGFIDSRALAQEVADTR
ncbi:MAG TPA: hypothetical protein VFQ12_09725 [Thermoleophilaceae bacterium]|nr:hypothetical protein [Thermoleophilaceae bacterium]